MNGKDRAEFWRERVEAWRRSGQSRTEFAAGHGIDRWTLGRWIRRLVANEASAPGHRAGPMDKPMLWACARDDRPWLGPDPPAVVYFYTPDRNDVWCGFRTCAPRIVRGKESLRSGL